VANIKSQIKRNRQNEAARVRNRAVRSSLKTATKKVQSDEGDVAASLRSAARMIDKAASKGTLHKRAAARRKSRLARQANAAG
jgi:small subunit ribosomal protein S20